MRLKVRLTLPGTWRGKYYSENYITFECVVVKIRSPVHSWRNGKTCGGWIYADVILPEKYHRFAVEGAWNTDGTYPVEVVIAHNAKSLAPFLGSGDREWYVREEQ
ncbi:hypothetical protein [Burkholderia alba]|uniref:hypothetical protein n=1 Tax=Burkholderia alba TaxID=2683677 RepID=UPI002B05FE30|nr:hypothetical protein [Burkholderia alba]